LVAGITEAANPSCEELAVAVSAEAEEAFEEGRAAASSFPEEASFDCGWMKLPHQTSRESSGNTNFMFLGLICEGRGRHQRLSFLTCCSAVSGCREDKGTQMMEQERKVNAGIFPRCCISELVTLVTCIFLPQ